MLHRQLVHHPIAHARQGFGVDRPTGCTDGRQYPPSPLLRTTRLLQAQEETRRGTAERQVAGLPCAAPPLTASPSPWLLAVLMQGRDARPAMAIDQHHPSVQATLAPDLHHPLWECGRRCGRCGGAWCGVGGEVWAQGARLGPARGLGGGGGAMLRAGCHDAGRREPEALAVIAAGVARGVEAPCIVRAARMLQGYALILWDTLWTLHRAAPEPAAPAAGRALLHRAAVGQALAGRGRHRGARPAPGRAGACPWRPPRLPWPGAGARHT